MEVTKVVVAQPKSHSLRTTVPASIARQFGIDENTQLGWEIEARGDELRIIIRPIEREPGAGSSGERLHGNRGRR